jgi:hypothetical protein
MTKPKIKLNLSATASESATESPVTTEAPDSGGETTTETETATETESADDAETDTETPEANTVTTTPGAKTLADFRSAFGHEQGSVFFADQVPFVDACVKHMASQAATITAQTAEIAALKKTGTELAAKLKGEAEPLATGPTGDKTPATGDAAVSDFAKSVEARLAK